LEQPLYDQNFYRCDAPKSDVDHPKSINDIQTFYIILLQQSDECDNLSKIRIIQISKKKVPDDNRKNFCLAVVENSRNIIDIIENLKEQFDKTAKIENCTTQVHQSDNRDTWSLSIVFNTH
jgi:hypothetical protein